MNATHNPGVDWRRRRAVVYAVFALAAAAYLSQFATRRLLGGEMYPQMIMPGFADPGVVAGRPKPLTTLRVEIAYGDGSRRVLSRGELFRGISPEQWSPLSVNLRTRVEAGEPIPRAMRDYLLARARSAAPEGAEPTAMTLFLAAPLVDVDEAGRMSDRDDLADRLAAGEDLEAALAATEVVEDPNGNRVPRLVGRIDFGDGGRP